MDEGAAAVNADDPKVKAIGHIREQINEERKKRFDVIGQLNMIRNKLRYKENEHEALSRLLAMTPPEGKNVGRLKRMKESIEFRIATEAGSLKTEKEMIKKLGDIDAELEEALKAYRFKRKAELVGKDIEDLKKRYDLLREQLKEYDTKLDSLYADLKRMTGWGSGPSGATGRPMMAKKHSKQQEPLEISLEDIATIKKKQGGDSKIGE
ncbi:Uncharacterised protein [uncultured archaeon]|nr:Uncharacterised protein [uncultured archaeon]